MIIYFRSTMAQSIPWYIHALHMGLLEDNGQPYCPDHSDQNQLDLLRIRCIHQSIVLNIQIKK